MKILIAEDNIVTQKLLFKFVSPYGDCDIANDGEEAIEIFHNAIEKNDPYQVIFLDIMIPKIDGHTILKEIRKIEDENGIFGRSNTKISMTSALDDCKNIMTAFKHQCEAYITKPFNKDKILNELKNLGII